MTTIISGTNRASSNTLKVAKYYQKQLSAKGLATNLINLQELPATFIASDLYGNRSPEFSKMLDLVNQSSKFLFVIPEYNGSFPGVLKTFIDACDFQVSFNEKKACLVGVSTGKYGNVRGIDHFSGVCAYLNLHVMPLRLHLANIKAELNENDEFFKDDTIKFTTAQVEKFIHF
jgi:chromate reductase, NAD(P)H dehydrogenase (quinone)